jgi:DNA damage-binding protein 1
MMKTWARVNNTTVLLGDSAGGLYVCEHGGADVRVQRVGSTSVPSALAYLDSGVVFVGSALGDSQLVRIDGEGVNVVDEMVNLGPIVDFICVESGLVVCGGSGIRNVRFGVGITELGAAPLSGARRVWGVGDRVVVGLAGGENVVLALVAGEVADVSEAMGGLMKVAERTVECFECDGKIVQVTGSAVYCDGKAVWTCGAGVEVLHAANSPGSRSLLLATTSANTRSASVVDCHNGQVFTVFTLPQEPSSCAILDDRQNGGPVVCSATLWDGSVMVWNDGIECIEALDEDQMPRSVRIKKQDKDVSILVGTGQGLAISWRLAGTRLEDRQQVPIGYQPVILRDLGGKIVGMGSSTAIMKGSIWSMVNTGVNVRVFDAALWQEYIVVVVEGGIKFWELGDKSGVQIERVNIDSIPRRLALGGGDAVIGRSIFSSTLLVATSKGETESIILRSADGHIHLDEIELPGQIVCSVCATKTDAMGYYVGTAVSGESREPTAGCIKRFDVSDSRLLVGQTIATNGTFSMAIAHG